VICAEGAVGDTKARHITRRGRPRP